jgi:hypothetical protein
MCKTWKKKCSTNSERLLSILAYMRASLSGRGQECNLGEFVESAKPQEKDTIEKIKFSK